MVRLHALELLPDAAGDRAVRRDWQALRDGGLPSQLDHTGTSNAPHLTLLAAPAIPPTLEALAVDLLGPLLPVTARLSGVLVLGGARATVARVVEVPDALTGAVLRLRAACPDPRYVGWLAHVTVARRVARSELATVLDALPTTEEPLVLATLRRWDPDRDAVETLVGG